MRLKTYSLGMASEVVIRVTDDTDRSKLADKKAVIGWEGVDYSLDLTTANYKKLAAALAPWLEAAHERVKHSKPAKKKPDKVSYPPVKLGREERDSVREWAREHGHTVGEKGIISRRVVAAYTEAHSG